MFRHFRATAVFVLAITVVMASSSVVGQHHGPTQDEPSDSAKDKQADKQPEKEKRGALVIAPIPISSPAFGVLLLRRTSSAFSN